ncbi:MAG: DUF2085 domain-containing protein, partial [Candidatus Hodarchaeota archaeon]
ENFILLVGGDVLFAFAMGCFLVLLFGYIPKQNIISILILFICASAISGAFLLLDVVFLSRIKTEKHFYHPTLTHHIIEEKDHSIKATIGNFNVYFCTRCSGMLLGIAVAIYAFVTFKITIDPTVAFIIDIFLPMPIFIDWGTQRLGFRKSTTASRIFTGALTGLGMYFITFTTPTYSLPSALLLGSYFALLFIIYFVSAKRGYYDDEDKDDIDEFDDFTSGELNTKG